MHPGQVLSQSRRIYCIASSHGRISPRLTLPTTTASTLAPHEKIWAFATHTIADGAREIYAWLEANGKLEGAESVPNDNRIIATWERLSVAMREELTT